MAGILPGFCPGLIGGLPLPIQLFKWSSISGTDIILPPSGIIAGDLLLHFDTAASHNAPISNVVPSEFTQIVALEIALDAGTARQTVSYKIAEGDEDVGVITGMDSDVSQNLRKIMLVYRFTDGSVIASASVSTPTSQSTTGDPSSQNVAASGATGPSVGFGCFTAGQSINTDAVTGGVTSRRFAFTASTSQLVARAVIQDAGGVDFSIDMGDHGDINQMSGFYIHNFGFA